MFITQKLAPVERRVFLRDTFRKGVDGLIESFKETVFLLVAIQLFQVSDLLKSTITSSYALGLVCTILLPYFLQKVCIQVDKAIGIITICIGLCVAFAGFASTKELYTILVSVSLFLFAIRIPLFTRIYSEVYDKTRRAKLFNYGNALLMIIALGCNYISGLLLENSLETRKYIYMVAGFLIMLNSLWLFTLGKGIAKSTVQEKGSTQVSMKKKDKLYPFSLIWKNPVFGKILGLWFLLGFANLWSAPLRVAYISDPVYGLELSPQKVLMILGVIPFAVRLIFSWVWAYFFDKLSFVVIRVIVNILMGCGIFLFFITSSITIMIFATVILNIALAGSPILWNLWVARIAPHGKAQDYMVVHTTMAGIRGFIGPYLAFLVAGGFSVVAVGTISLSLTLISAVGFIYTLRNTPI